MKKLIGVLTLIVILPLLANAAEKMHIIVGEETISVKVGKKEFVADRKFENLKFLRVWKKPDHVEYDISASGLDVSANPDKKKPTMTEEQATQEWTMALLHFQKIKGALSVHVLTPTASGK